MLAVLRYQSYDRLPVVHRPDAGSIPAHVDYLLKDRAAWEEHYKWRYQWNDQRYERHRQCACLCCLTC
jgi:hypothetical protein